MMKHVLRILLFSFTLTTLFAADNNDKWIVVTTIQYPTPALYKLASLPGWRLVVVGDKKTPKDWHLDNCIYISVEDQEKLPYQIIKYLPWNHYARKNIGYLYAIEHGAQIIYETDDDNIILNAHIDYLPERTEILQYATDASAVNVYEHFGQSRVWPRGYPLSQVTAPAAYTLVPQQTNIPIQQGLVNGDPDVDAIFRLTHAQETFFSSDAQPVSLPAQVLCPFNTQNTLFYRSAFWALLVPVTTAFRVCDIWRGYWMQTLLWDIGGSLCFLPPTAIQYRNSHNLLKDFADELDLYLRTEELIVALNNWRSSTLDFSTRMQELMDSLVGKGFFKPKESILLNAWLADLQRIGYEMPALQCLSAGQVQNRAGGLTFAIIDRL